MYNFTQDMTDKEFKRFLLMDRIKAVLCLIAVVLLTILGVTQ